MLPFSIRDSHPTDIDGIPMTTYIDWLKSCYWITLAGHPAVSVMCGLSKAAGLPLGMQLVGPSFSEALILRAAAGYERAAPWREMIPTL